MLDFLSSKCMVHGCFNIIRYCSGCCGDFTLIEGPCSLCRDPVRHHDTGAGREGDHRVWEDKVFLGAGVQAQGSFQLPDADEQLSSCMSGLKGCFFVQCSLSWEAPALSIRSAGRFVWERKLWPLLTDTGWERTSLWCFSVSTTPATWLWINACWN